MATLFFDNNIPIGYCFIQDPQHKKAKTAFNSKSLIYWSKNVKYEFKKVFNNKILILEDFIYSIKSKLNDIKEILDKNRLIDIIFSLKNQYFTQKSIKIIVNDIWNSANFNEKILSSEIIGYLEDYKRSFKKIAIKFKSDCYKQINMHERTKLYPKIETLLKNCVDGEDSLKKLGNDMNIILDAHDLSYNSNIFKLAFITDDIPLFHCKNLIETHTKIYDVCNLHEYEF
ncbi:MAG: hypothetical protein LBM96_04310 [Methanobrevibacter sp.]|jgi:hypothetical protein|nr:hypothetical protein [Candidatus Methanoflexus mossambicus]